MIHSIKLVRLRNGEYVQYLADILAIVSQNGPAQLNVQRQYEALLAMHNNIETLFKTPGGSRITKELEDLDLRRDNVFAGINGIINAFGFSPNTVLKNSADLLASHLAIFGTGIAQDNYQSETAKLANIMKDWDTKPNLAAALEDLGLQPWVAELAEANHNFNQQYLARAAEKGSTSPDSFKALRSPANEAYFQLRHHLDANNTINNGTGLIGETVSFINGIIDNYNNLLARRNGNGDVNNDPVPPVA